MDEHTFFVATHKTTPHNEAQYFIKVLMFVLFHWKKTSIKHKANRIFDHQFSIHCCL